MNNAFDLTVRALREQGLNSDEILEELSKLFQELANPRSKSVKQEDTEEKIMSLLDARRMPKTLKGYEFWVTAIQVRKNNGRNMSLMQLQEEVAVIHGRTSYQVMMRMKLAFDRCWKTENMEELEFLDFLADQI